MFSIIIPTMQKDVDILNKLLTQLNEDKSIGEIIVIDNSGKGLNFNSEKLRVILKKENIFVNPAWNLGIEESSGNFKYFGILNDDIIFPKNLFSQVLNFLESSASNTGLVGIDCISNTPKAEFNTYPDDSDVKFVVADKLKGFWGSAYFGNKKNYVKIPEAMKIFYGDHFLFRKNQQAGRINYFITNLTVKHLESLTSHSSPFLENMFKKDRKFCIKYDGVESQKLNFIQRIFSITDYHNHTVICFLGIKIKIKHS